MAERLIEKRMSEEPIILPGSPFWESFKVFGRDELIALGVNVAGTVAVSKFINDPAFLSLTGPVVEKIGLYLAHFKEAADVYRTTPKEQRKGIQKYLATAVKKGSESLGKDIIGHDPTYALLMYLGLNNYPDTPVWMISTLSFLVAIGAVTVGEVGINEARYFAQTEKFKRLGFGLQNYFEARFYIKEQDTEGLLPDMAKKFNLWKEESADYHDRYFAAKLNPYNGRRPVFRLRQRNDGDGFMQTAQIAHTTISRVQRKNPDQFNFFPARKDKMWIHLPGEMPWTLEEIADNRVRKAAAKIASAPSHDVYFSRSVVRDPETILVSVDNVNAKDSGEFTVIEVKSHPDEKSRTMLVEAMRHIMLNYPVIQTTHSKNMLTSLPNSKQGL